MADASSTTRRRKQRTLFADKVIQQTNFEKGWKNYIKLEGGYPGLGAISAPPYLDMIDGATETTNEQRLAYIDSVPDKFRVPDAPTNVTATSGNAQASVSFTAPSDGGSPITGYKVTSNPTTTTVPGTSSPIVFTGLTNGTSYTFRVVATNIKGDSPASGPSNAVTPATTPSAPTSLAATAGDSEASISFTAGSDGGSGITNYEYSTNGTTWTALSPADVASPVTITGLTNGVAYTIYLRGVNAVGSGASSSGVSVTPVSPTNFIAVGTTTWTAPTGVTSIEYIVIGGGGGGGGAYDVGGGGGGGGGLILSGTKSVTPGTTYTITVGGGGAGGTGTGGGGGDTSGESGNSSSFDDIIAPGGGGGGGSLNDRTGTGGAQGNAGTTTAPTGGKGGRTVGGNGYGGGGGGGMGGAGTSASNNAGAAGGSGITVTIGGTSVSGGAGGDGGDRGTNYNGAAGSANTGNGGGGGAAVSADGSSGGAGGSGRVVIQY